MSVPASVNQILLPRARAKRQGPRRRLRVGEERLDDGDTNEPGIGIGVGGTVLDFGKDGGVGLERKKGNWNWVWAEDERNGMLFAIISFAYSSADVSRSKNTDHSG